MDVDDGSEEEYSGWRPQTASPPVDRNDLLVDEAHYQGFGNLAAGFLLSVGLLAIVVATFWVQPSLPPADRLVGGELWAVVGGSAIVSVMSYLVFARPRVHVKDGTFTLVGAARNVSFPVHDIAEVGTRFGYAYVRLRSGQRLTILGLDAAPVRIDAELERFERDFARALSTTGTGTEQPNRTDVTVSVRWLPSSRGLVLLVIAWVAVGAYAAAVAQTGGW